jgi:adenylyl-sulfate kinase
LGPVSRGPEQHTPEEPTAAGLVVWFAGRPCSGKSTIAVGAADALQRMGYGVQVLDGDDLRRTLSPELGFGKHDRLEHGRRVARYARAIATGGEVAIAALISPFAAMRDQAREVIGEAFLEVYIDAPLRICEDRDVKGHYALARSGQLPEFTGVTSPFEAPASPDLRIDTDAEAPADSIARLVRFVAARMQDHHTDERVA